MEKFFRRWIGWNRFYRSHKLQTLICIIGLSVGMACYAFSLLWIRDIESYENFVPDAERIFVPGEKNSALVSGISTYNGDPYLAKLLSANIPEIESSAVIYSSHYYDNKYKIATDKDIEKEIFVNLADSSFVNMFGIEPVNSLAITMQENHVMITESLSKEIFGGDNPLGRKVRVRQNPDSMEEYVVYAVIPDWADNSQFGCDAILYYDKPQTVTDFHQMPLNHVTFIKLRRGADAEEVEQKISKLAEDHDRVFEMSMNKDLMPLTDLKSRYPNKRDAISLEYVRIFLLIGLLVMACAIANYIIMLLNFMRMRQRDMAMHRLLGAGMRDIISLSMLDTLILFLISALLGGIVIILLSPVFQRYASISMSLDAVILRLAAYLAVIMAVGLVSSAVTVFVVLHNGNRSIQQWRTSRRVSVRLENIGNVIQFMLCMVMVACSSVMVLQLRYLSHTNALGFERENVFAFFNITPEIKKSVIESPYVEDYISGPRAVYPIFTYSTLDVSPSEKRGDKPLTLDLLSISEKISDFWKMNKIEGRYPKPGTNEIMLNENACRLLGSGSQIGRTLYANNENTVYNVVGVMADLYIVPPTQTPAPAMYTAYEYKEPTDPYDNFGRFCVKLHPGMKKDFLDFVTPAIDKEQEAWRNEHEGEAGAWQYTTSLPNDLESEYDEMLSSERMLMQLMMAIAVCGILTSIFSAYSTLNLSLRERRKEIALRKISGAKPRQIANMFFRTYLIMLVVAAIIATVVSFVVMTRWLEGFMEHIAFPWYVMVLTFMMMVAIVFITIGHQTLAASRAGEAEAIKEN